MMNWRGSLTANEFIDKLQEYYAKELPAMAKSMTIKYLAEYPEENLTRLFGIVLKYQPIKWGCPAIATIEKAHRDHIIGDERNKIPGGESIKVKRRSACAPVEEKTMTNQEWEEAAEGLDILKMMVENEGRVLE